MTKQELARKMRYLDQHIKSLPLGQRKRDAVKVYKELRDKMKYTF